jgi:hypothetical protein
MNKINCKIKNCHTTLVRHTAQVSFDTDFKTLKSPPLEVAMNWSFSALKTTEINNFDVTPSVPILITSHIWQDWE